MDEKIPQNQTKQTDEKTKYNEYRSKLNTVPYDERPILWLDEVDLSNISSVGGKMCSLGELTKIGVPIRIAFALSTYAYRCIIEDWGVKKYLDETLVGIPKDKPSVLARIGEEIRTHLRHKKLPKHIQDAIKEAYVALGWLLGKKKVVCAVRSSATAEDSPEASFAGQQDTFLYRSGGNDIVNMVKECIISLFNDRAIDYRMQMDFEHAEVEISVAVQEMVISQVAGVTFTLDPESGFRDVIVINAGFGVGETVVGGEQEPDEYLVFKPKMTIIDKRIASKKIRMVQDPVIGTKKEQVPKKDRKKQALTNAQILKLAEYCASIEKHYGRPMDIEWALDDQGELVILQARPETIHSNIKESDNLEFYKITASDAIKKSSLIVTGQNIGNKIGIGTVRVFASVDEARKRFQNGDIIVTHMTDPDWEPWMKIASAIVTESGGRTCHAAIICRELGIPCIVGAHEATDLLKEGQEVTVDCSEGTGQVFNGILPFEIIVIDASVKSKTRTKIYMIVGEPDMAFEYAKYHIDGYGLVRLEFIINSYIGIHPLALYHFYDLQKKYDKVNQGQVYIDFFRSLGFKEALTGFQDLINAAETVKHHIDVLPLIEEITEGYLDKKEYYIEKLAFGIARIAASIYPKKAIIRLEDLKSNEYWNLKGGRMFEVLERNTMIGFRGSSRYYDQRYRPAFDMGCESLRRVIKQMKLDNIVIMLPFTRTPEEGIRVRGILAENGLGDVSTIVMNELPSNNILIDDFLDIFDGFSIGTNDLTQLNLALDRDSELVSHLYDERHFAVRRPLIASIKRAVERGKYTGICGQAPSDWPSMCAFLIECGISSIALNPDVVVSTRALVRVIEYWYDQGNKYHELTASVDADKTSETYNSARIEFVKQFSSLEDLSEAMADVVYGMILKEKLHDLKNLDKDPVKLVLKRMKDQGLDKEVLFCSDCHAFLSLDQINRKLRGNKVLCSKCSSASEDELVSKSYFPPFGRPFNCPYGKGHVFATYCQRSCSEFPCQVWKTRNSAIK